MNLRSAWCVILFFTAACSSNESSPPRSVFAAATKTESLETGSAPEGSIDKPDGNPCGVRAGLAALPGSSISVWAKATSHDLNPDSNSTMSGSTCPQRPISSR
jgi:hypothetical protein